MVRDRAATAGVVRATCHRFGWDRQEFHHDPRGRTNTVFVNVNGRVVLVIAPVGTDRQKLSRTLGLARYVSANAPFVRPLGGIDQPVNAEGRLVTLWELVPVGSGEVDYEKLGSAVRDLHRIAPSSLSSLGLVPDALVWDSLGGSIDDLGTAGKLAPDHVEQLAAQYNELTPAAQIWMTPSRQLAHGDLHLGNILNGRQGPILCDTDELILAAPIWDLSYLFDPGRRLKPSESDVRPFEAGYGGRLPDTETRSLVARAAHLRFTIRLAQRAQTARDRFWVNQWLETWREAGIGPVRHITLPSERTRTDQLRRVLVATGRQLAQRRPDSPGGGDRRRRPR